MLLDGESFESPVKDARGENGFFKFCFPNGMEWLSEEPALSHVEPEAKPVLKRPAVAADVLPEGWTGIKKKRANGKQAGHTYSLYRAPDGNMHPSWAAMVRTVK